MMFRLFAIATCCLLTTASFADQMRLALATRSTPIHVRLYSVSDDGSVGYMRTICRAGDRFGDVTLFAPTAAVSAPDGTVYVYDSYPKDASYATRILKFDAFGGFRGVFVDNLAAGAENGGIDTAILSPDGAYLYASVPFGTDAGTVYRHALADGSGGAFITGLSTPRGMDFDSSGWLYVATRGDNKVRVFTVTQAGATEIPTANYPCDRASGVCVDRAHNRVYVSGYTAVCNVYMQGESSGTPLRTFTPGANVTSMAAAGGTVYLSGYDAKCLQKYVYDAGTDGELSDVDFPGCACGCVSSFTVAEADLFTGRWRFDETANTGLFTNDCRAAWTGVVTYAQLTGTGGASGGALRLGAHGTKAGRARFRNSANLFPEKGDMSVFLWVAVPVKVTSETYLFANRYSGQEPGRTILAIDNHKFRLFNGSFPSALVDTGATEADDGFWHHVGFVRSGNTFALYVDGGRRASGEMPASTTLASGYDWCLGCDSAEFYRLAPEGTCFDDLRVYERALSSAEIVNLYNGYSFDKETLPPAPTSVYDPSAVTPYGTVLRHLFAWQTSLDGLSLAADSAGARWAGVGTAMARAAGDAYALFAKSSDGTTWSELAAAPNLAVPSLWPAADGRLHAFGGWTSFCDKNIDTSRLYADFALAEDGSAATLVTYVTNEVATATNVQRAQTPCADAAGRLVLPYAAGGAAGFVSFAPGAAGAQDIVFAVSEAAGVLTPSAAVATNGVVTGFFGAEDGSVRAYAASATPAETPLPLGAETLAGAAAPYAILPVAEKGERWAVTTADGYSLKLHLSRGSDPWREVATILALPAIRSFRLGSPTLLRDGEDLLVGYLLSGPDGSVGARSPSEPNYAMVTRVARFRRFGFTGTAAVFK